MINIALLGYGVVNTGLVEILEEKKDDIKKAIGDDFKISKILVKNPDKHQDIKNLLVKDISEIVEDDTIDLVIEATGEVEEIGEDIKKILASKNLISSNKALVSRYFEDLEEISQKNKTKLRFDAAVGGATPLIETLYTIRTLNDVKKFEGIVNGSCNFILSKMEEGEDFDTALKKAQDLGFAEADPSDDIEGFDSLRKLRIVASILFKKPIKEEEISLEGITKITKKDVERASEDNKRYKLIAYADNEGRYEIRPRLVEKDSNFGTIKDNENIFEIDCTNAKKLTFKAPGAGKRETGFAVLNDFLSIFSKR